MHHRNSSLSLFKENLYPNGFSKSLSYTQHTLVLLFSLASGMTKLRIGARVECCKPYSKCKINVFALWWNTSLSMYRKSIQIRMFPARVSSSVSSIRFHAQCYGLRVAKIREENLFGYLWWSVDLGLQCNHHLEMHSERSACVIHWDSERKLVLFFSERKICQESS